jgi:hypothetical protein
MAKPSLEFSFFVLELFSVLSVDSVVNPSGACFGLPQASTVGILKACRAMMRGGPKARQAGIERAQSARRRPLQILWKMEYKKWKRTRCPTRTRSCYIHENKGPRIDVLKKRSRHIVDYQ